MIEEKEVAVQYQIGDADIRPWGTWKVIAIGEGYICKEICIMPKQRLSLQSHKHRSEHWIILDGNADVTLDDEVLKVESNHTVFIPKKAKHRIENRGSSPLTFVEVQTGEILDESDIQRFADEYGRV